MATRHVETKIHEAVVEDFRNTLRGRLLSPSDDGYDTARQVWNAMIDHRPALIARCVGVSDVIASVRFARDHNMLLSIKGGGHNVSGKAVCNDGLMIDLSPMKGIRVDPVAMTARAEPGVLWQELDHETQAFGLATTGGVVATTGIAGLTLGGGQGWLAGKYGFTVDNLLSADVVTADGRLLRASAAENPDLFWALRGAGHNFGVATSFEYRLHPVPSVLGGMVIHPLDQARDVLRFYREFSAALPDELTVFAGILTAPDGNVVIALVACYAGPTDEGERVLAPLRFFGSPVADTIAEIPYTAMQALMTGACPYGRQNYWKTGLTNQITDEVIDAMIEYGSRIPSPHTAIVLGGFAGAYLRVGRTETAYYHRDMQYDFIILSSWEHPADSDRNIQWTRDLFQAVEPHLSGRVYVNDLGDESGDRVRSAYGENYDRLVELKTKYDPTNLFRLNQNISPRRH
ncbi:MAG TPA: FAD-binding oxidoreductase [Thermomicrobiales bacterium]|nr:FAD-binding oxidoreductase [Thermomicrobiales bacterium]